jgi:RecB family exonuclease
MSHSRFAPSAAIRWLTCPGSVREESKYPDAPGPAAQLGTRLHEIAATALMTSSEISPQPDLTEEQLQIVKDYVRYVDAMGTEQEFKGFEVPLKLSESVYGTADTVLIRDGALDVIDLKTGSQLVSARENPQLLTYASAAVAQLGGVYEIEKIRLHIVQPSLKWVEVWETDRTYIKTWTSKIEAAIKAADNPDAPLNPSDEACNWCRARFVCKARAHYALELARQEFALVDPSALSVDQLSNVLLHKKRVEQWLADAYAHALKSALNGVPIPNFSLGETRSVRAFANETEVKKRLFEAGFAEIDFMETKLLALTNIEKLVGRKKFAELFNNGLVVKKPGKPALTPCTESLPSLSSAATLVSE